MISIVTRRARHTITIEKRYVLTIGTWKLVDKKNKDIPERIQEYADLIRLGYEFGSTVWNRYKHASGIIAHSQSDLVVNLENWKYL